MSEQEDIYEELRRGVEALEVNTQDWRRVVPLGVFRFPTHQSSNLDQYRITDSETKER